MGKEALVSDYLQCCAAYQKKSCIALCVSQGQAQALAALVAQKEGGGNNMGAYSCAL